MQPVGVSVNIINLLHENARLKKITAISFSLLLLFTQLGHVLFFSVQLMNAKDSAQLAMSSGSHEDDYTLIDLETNFASIRWEEIGNEFSLNGNMYDVAFISKVNGKTILFCYDDEMEKGLKDGYSKSIQSSRENDNTGKQQTVANLFSIDLFFKPAEISCSSGFLTADQMFFYKEQFPLNSYIQINSPPPESCI